MAMNQNNNRSIVNRLAFRGVKTGRQTRILTAFSIALTAMLITAMILQVTGLTNSQKKMLERVQQVVYMNLTEAQMKMIKEDERLSSSIAYKRGQGVKENGVLLQSIYCEPSTWDMERQNMRLSEGRMAETSDEIVVDKATLRLFGLPVELGTEITINFLNSKPETFSVTGLTDNETAEVKLSIHELYLSREYAENGPQLANEPWFLMGRLKGGADMNGPALKDLIYKLGQDYTIAYQNINPNDYYIRLRTLDFVSLSAYAGAAAALTGISFLIIYSIFYLSVSGRVRQFGQLRTIGMTKKQLRSMVKKEGFLLWSIGTPAGFITGSLFMLLLGPQNGWQLSNNLLALASSAVVCAVAVRMGVQKPASLASSISPIEAARYESFKGKSNSLRHNSHTLTPFGLAVLNFARSFKKQFLTMLSLAVGGILFMTAAIYISGWDLDAYSRQGAWKNSEYQIFFDYNTKNSVENGTSSLQLEDLMSTELQKDLMNLPGVERIISYHGVTASIKWEDIQSTDSLTPVERIQSAPLLNYLEDGTGDYDQLVESGGVYVNMSGQWKEAYGKVPEVGDVIEVTYYNGETHTVNLPVVGVGGDRIRAELTDSSWLLIPRETADALFGDMNTTKSLAIVMKDHSHTVHQDEQMISFMSDYPKLTLYTLTERMQTDIADFAVLKALLISIGGFVILFSLVNLLNTLLSGLMTRKQQLTMLAALGMTHRQIWQMLSIENLFMAAINIISTFILGTLSGFCLCRLLISLGANYMRFRFPLGWFLLYTAVAIGAPLLISRICLKNLYKESLTDRLRSVE